MTSGCATPGGRPLDKAGDRSHDAKTTGLNSAEIVLSSIEQRRHTCARSAHDDSDRAHGRLGQDPVGDSHRPSLEANRPSRFDPR